MCNIHYFTIQTTRTFQQVIKLKKTLLHRLEQVEFMATCIIICMYLCFTLHFQTNEGAKRVRRCNECSGCKERDCDSCINCRDMKRFGGPGRRKKCCIQRKCVKQGTCMSLYRIVTYMYIHLFMIIILTDYTNKMASKESSQVHSTAITSMSYLHMYIYIHVSSITLVWFPHMLCRSTTKSTLIPISVW